MISTHLLDIAESICDRVVIIDKGIVVEQDTIKNLKEKEKESIYEKIINNTIWNIIFMWL